MCHVQEDRLGRRLACVAVLGVVEQSGRPSLEASDAAGFAGKFASWFYF